MTSLEDGIPDVDRFEQGMPLEPDPRYQRRHRSDEPEPDVLEQEIPVGDVPAAEDHLVMDGERIEPVDDTDPRNAQGEL
jgi:hypothetical protein